MERVHVRGQATKPALFDDVSHSWESRRSKNGAEAKTVPHTLKLLIVPAEHCIASFVGVWVFSVGLFVSELWVHYVEKKRGVHMRMRCMWVYYMWVYYMWVYYLHVGVLHVGILHEGLLHEGLLRHEGHSLSVCSAACTIPAARAAAIAERIFTGRMSEKRHSSPG